jgi:hypothetical protein
MKPHGRIRGVPTWLVDHPGYQGLTSQARHVLLMLWWCEQAGLGRIFRLYPAVVAVQTGYDVETVEQALQELKESRWIEWDGTVVWVVSALAYDTATMAGPAVLKSIKGTLASLPQGQIQDAFRDTYITPYQTPYQSQEETLQEQTQKQFQEQRKREHEQQNQGSGAGSVSVSGSESGSDSGSVSEGSRGPSHTRSLADGPPTPSGRSLGAPGVAGEDSPSPPGSAAPPLPQGPRTPPRREPQDYRSTTGFRKPGPWWNGPQNSTASGSSSDSPEEDHAEE